MLKLGYNPSLTAVTKTLLDKQHAIQPTKYWRLGDKNLSEIYNDTYPPLEEE